MGTHPREVLLTDDSGELLEISVPVDGEAAEAVSELFDRRGGGAVIEGTPAPDGGPPTVVVRTYLAMDDYDGRARVEEGLWHLSRLYPIPESAVRKLASANWAEAWKADYAPMRIGERLLIVPSWCEAESQPGDLVITLDPGMAFGTGLHPSTRLCLVALEGLVADGTSVLDVGTGSGVLAIAAARCGAASVMACDTDPTAVAVAQENAQLNGVEVTITAGSVDEVPPGRFDVVVANILAGVITRLAPHLADRLAASGTLIVSGILNEQADDVALGLEAAGLAVTGRTIEGDWVALTAGHP